MYNVSPLPKTLEMAARIRIGNEALAKILTSHNEDLGNIEVVTEKKVRSQRKMVYGEAVNKRKGADAHGMQDFIFIICNKSHVK